jgi:hypothetical protein
VDEDDILLKKGSQLSTFIKPLFEKLPFTHEHFTSVQMRKHLDLAAAAWEEELALRKVWVGVPASLFAQKDLHSKSKPHSASFFRSKESQKSPDITF